MPKTLIAMLILLLTAGSAAAAHVDGHYGGVPAVRPAPLPWNPMPYPPPSYGAPPRPSYAPPPRRLYVPQLPQPAPPPQYRVPPPKYPGLRSCQRFGCD
ncbi:MAG: hypothetical protein ACRDI2_09970 [Chloroflexota bacterium]